MIYYMDLCYAHGNDAAIQIAVSVSGSVEEFANLMNKKAEELGLSNTHFITPHGLDEQEHYTTAYELAQIADYALNIDKISEVVKTKTYTVIINNNYKSITNTNELLGYLDGVYGIKTGFTNGAGRCLVTATKRDNFNIITVILGADTKKIRTKDSINLIEHIYTNYELINLEEMIEEQFNNWYKINRNRIYAYKGKEQKINVKLSDYKYKMYPVSKKDIKDIKISIEDIKTYFEAPMYINTKVGELNVKIRDKELMYIDIKTTNEIQRKDIKDYFIECLESILK